MRRPHSTEPMKSRFDDLVREDLEANYTAKLEQALEELRRASANERSEAIDALQFNKAVAQLYELVNALEKAKPSATRSEAIAALVHSTFSAQRRGAIDGFVAGLRTAYGLDLQRDVLDHITGHFAVVAYAASPDKTPSQWLTGAATEEAVFISLADAAPIGRFLDAATQLTRGTLRVQRVDGARTQWAWIADDVVRWTFILGPDYLLVVDGPSSLEHARRFQSEPSVPLPHDERGLDDLLSGNARSGFYLTRAALRALPGGTALFDDFDWVTIVADEAGAEELVRIDIGGFNKH
mgnify:CR=1 FL=1